ncbi:MAG: hypothetical protein V5B60_18695 [Accumulibacter sp.]|jgi:hypothetical protein|uniref:phage tail fiber protein n=1 Tax=Accumulibacter sp. TaxID=2053492 RepID=UPI002FC3B2D1
MSMSDATENATLKMHLQGTDPSYRAGATQYVALVSLASPDESAPIAAELTYTGYARIALTKSSAWTDGGSSFTNATQWNFGKRTDGGALQYARSFVIVDTASGPISQGIIGTLGAELAIGQNIKPVFEIGDATVSAT